MSVKLFTFRENDVVITGEKHNLVELARYLRDAEGTLGDLRYQIEYEFDIDGVRSLDDSSTLKRYGVHVHDADDRWILIDSFVVEAVSEDNAHDKARIKYGNRGRVVFDIEEI